MTDSPALQALASAVEAEKQSLEAYLKLAWQTSDPAGRAALIRLALDEFGHMRLLEEQQRSLQHAGDWVPAVPRQSAIEQVVPKLSSATWRVKGAAGLDQLTALRTALEMETRARAVYTDLGNHADSAPARAMFAQLVRMETAHAALLQAETDSIQTIGFWFGLPEFTLESEPARHEETS
jgi:rubrerythrin